MDTLTLNSKGQITIPAHVRKSLGLKPGSTLKLYQEPGNKGFSMMKTISIRDAIGILPKSKITATIEEMNEAVEKAVSDHVMGK